MKTCTGCLECKPESDFYFDKKSNALMSKCKVCIRARSRAYRAANLEKAKASQARYREEHHDEIAERVATRYAESPELQAAAQARVKQWKIDNPERVKENWRKTPSASERHAATGPRLQRASPTTGVLVTHDVVRR